MAEESNPFLELRESHIQCRTLTQEKLKSLESKLDDTREVIEKSLGDTRREIVSIGRVIRGNGEDGLVSRCRTTEERVKGLLVWKKWVMGIIAAIVVAGVGAIYKLFK